MRGSLFKRMTEQEEEEVVVVVESISEIYTSIGTLLNLDVTDFLIEYHHNNEPDEDTLHYLLILKQIITKLDILKPVVDHKWIFNIFNYKTDSIHYFYLLQLYEYTQHLYYNKLIPLFNLDDNLLYIHSFKYNIDSVTILTFINEYLSPCIYLLHEFKISYPKLIIRQELAIIHSKLYNVIYPLFRSVCLFIKSSICSNCIMWYDKTKVLKKAEKIKNLEIRKRSVQFYYLTYTILLSIQTTDFSIPSTLLPLLRLLKDSCMIMIGLIRTNQQMENGYTKQAYVLYTDLNTKYNYDLSVDSIAKLNETSYLNLLGTDKASQLSSGTKTRQEFLTEYYTQSELTDILQKSEPVIILPTDLTTSDYYTTCNSIFNINPSTKKQYFPSYTI